MDDKIKKEIQSATFERLLSHLDERKDVQNIDPVSYTHLTLPTICSV